MRMFGLRSSSTPRSRNMAPIRQPQGTLRRPSSVARKTPRDHQPDTTTYDDMLAPSPPLRVTASSFFRLECAHEQLFHSEYKRYDLVIASRCPNRA
ncbi:hypothetical protein C6341_g26434 [Phytophthora cactorum]|nr:hypothetical protein C6341_g26434 [Phytophthora cactorum]